MSTNSPDIATRIVHALVSAQIHTSLALDVVAGIDITRAVLAESKNATDEKKAERIIDSLDEVDLLIEPVDSLKAQSVVLDVLTARPLGTALHSAGKGEVLPVRLDPPGLAPGQQGIPVDVFALSVDGRYVAWCVGKGDAKVLEGLHDPERCIIDRATIVSVNQDTPRAPDALDPDLQRVQDGIDALAAERRAKATAPASEPRSHASEPVAQVLREVWDRVPAGTLVADVLAEVARLWTERTEPNSPPVVVSFLDDATPSDHLVLRDLLVHLRSLPLASRNAIGCLVVKALANARVEAEVALSPADRLLLAEACRRAEGESYGHDPAEESKRDGWLRLAKVLGG